MLLAGTERLASRPVSVEMPRMTDETEIGLFEAMYSQRAIRRFKSDPVPKEMLEKLVEAATKAPSGGNAQPWAFIVVTDDGQRSRLHDIARRTFKVIYGGALKRQKPGDPPPMKTLKRMIDEIDNIPAWIIVCTDSPSGAPSFALQASIYPAVQNLLLAARGLGLGAVLTLLMGGDELPATREVLNLPENVNPVAFIPIGFPAEGTKYGPTKRRPLSEVLHWDGWQSDRSNTAEVAYRAKSD